MSTAAAIVPYGMNEDSIIYVSTDWGDLKSALTNPVVYLGAKGLINSPLQWRLKPHTTVLIEPYDHNPTRAARFVALFKPLGVDTPSLRRDAAKSPAGIEVLAQHAKEIAKSQLADGAWMTEFALNTGVLVVRYKVPNKFDEPDEAEAPSATHFRGKLTEPTYIGVEGSKCGNVHFDIEKNIGQNDVNRAALIMDMLENPHRVFSRLGDHIHNTARLGPLNPSTPLEIHRSTKTIRPRYQFSSVRPPIVVENMSSFEPADPCGLCIDGQTYEECSGDPQVCVWYIDGVMYKCYTQPS